MRTATEIVSELEDAVKEVTKTSDTLKSKQDEVQQAAQANQEAVQKVNSLREELNESLNDQLSAVGMAQNPRVRTSR